MKHTPTDLFQMQALPLEVKIQMTERRIETWIDNWAKFEIYNAATGKRRYVTWDTREWGAPPLKEHEYIDQMFNDWAYLSFSGGKDSTVLDDILTNMGIGGDRVPRVFCDTGLEYPQVRMFANARSDVILRPEMRFDKVLAVHGYPIISKEVSKKTREARNGAPSAIKAFMGQKLDGSECSFKKRFVKYAPLINMDFKISDKCCDEMKKKPFKKYEKETGRKAILATMAHESQLRATAWMRNGCNAFEAARAVSTPMAFWTDQDVLQYIQKKGIEIASVYGEVIFANEFDTSKKLTDPNASRQLTTTGCHRTGCIFCPFACHRPGGKDFAKLKETHPRQWAFCIGGGEYNEEGYWQPSKEGLGLGHVFDELNSIYGEDFIKYGKE